MRVAQIGNFVPEFSTENDLRWAMESLGWHVRPIQEGDIGPLDELFADLRRPGDVPDFILWTRTRDLADKWGHEAQWRLLAEARQRKVPVVGYHLDRWWGLKRQTEIETEPFFRVDLLVTADGGHDDLWRQHGINHVWALPAVSERWCQPGQHRDEYDCDVVFVGSWQGYHREWAHRQELVTKLSDRFGDRFKVFPAPGQHAIRGLELNDVYWSAKVVVGDSCLVPKVDGSPMTHYCSDRIPETLGRGGILCHPSVEGIDKTFGRHLPWDLGDWSDLNGLLDVAINAPEGSWNAGLCSPGGGTREAARLENIAFVREQHTYTVRMSRLGEILAERMML